MAGVSRTRSKDGTNRAAIHSVTDRRFGEASCQVDGPGRPPDRAGGPPSRVLRGEQSCPLRGAWRELAAGADGHPHPPCYVSRRMGITRGSPKADTLPQRARTTCAAGAHRLRSGQAPARRAPAPRILGCIALGQGYTWTSEVVGGPARVVPASLAYSAVAAPAAKAGRRRPATVQAAGGRSSGVERNVANVDVVGSNPIARSTHVAATAARRRPRFGTGRARFFRHRGSRRPAGPDWPRRPERGASRVWTWI